MSFYRNRVYPHIVSMLGNPKPVQNISQQLVPLAEGKVLEVGVGPGVNFVHYDPTKVSKVYALEPNPGMIPRAEQQGRHGRLIPSGSLRCSLLPCRTIWPCAFVTMRDPNDRATLADFYERNEPI